jgi:hypothetical protein
VTIQGTLTGGNGLNSASVFARRIGPVKVGGDLVGGVGQYSGSVQGGMGVASVGVTGSVRGGAGRSSGSIGTVNLRLGPVKVGGDVIGGTGPYSASITGDHVTSVEVTGSVTGGTGIQSASVVGEFSVGTVTVGGDWTGASVVAGLPIDLVHLFDPAAADAFLQPPGRIARIAVGGAVNGTAAEGDRHWFLGRQVVALTIGGVAVPLTAGAGNDDLVLGTFGDFRLVERVPPAA